MGRSQRNWMASVFAAALLLAVATGKANDFDFALTAVGPHNVVQGYPLYIHLEAELTAGTSAQPSLAVSGLPPGASASFPDLEAGCCRDLAGRVFAWGTPFKTAVEIRTSAATPAGTYTIRLEAKGLQRTKSVSYSFAVRQLPVPVTARAPVPLPALPEIATWEENMTRYGASLCDAKKIRGGDTFSEQGAWYYDGVRVYYQIADYTRSERWNACARLARDVYRDQYLLPKNGELPGFRVFPQGLLLDYRRTGDERSKLAALALSKRSAFASARARLWYMIDPARSREVAYAIEAYLVAEELGEPRSSNLQPFVEIALGHVDQWAISKNARFLQPFMAALTAEALIAYHDKTHDPRILPAVRELMEWVWASTWVSGVEAFRYSDRPTDDSTTTDPAPDLNLLIAPAFGWLYRQTGDPSFAEKGDRIFAGGVLRASVDRGKVFSQNYRWSFDYVKWRKGD